MPRPQYIGEDAPDPLAATLSGFTKRGQELRESDAIRNIYQNYQDQNQTIDQLLMGVNSDPDISPSQKVNIANQLVGLQKARANVISPEDRERQIQQLEDIGMPREEAVVAVDSGVKSAGAQHIIGRHVDLMNRGVRGEEPVSEEGLGGEVAEKSVPQTPEEIEWPEIQDTSPAATPKEKRVTFNEREKFNNKELKDEKQLNRTLKLAEQRFNTMEELNERGNLPENLDRILLDSEGNIRPIAQILKLANKDTQLFGKVLADFVSGAQEFFGGRVTNFEVGAFLKSLPSLLNTQEGRRAILEQLKLMNQLQKTWSDAKVKALQHYGGNASYSNIENMVDEQVRDMEKDAINKINYVVKASDYLTIMANNPEKYHNKDLLYTPDGQFRIVHKSKQERAKKHGLKKWNE